VTRTSDLPWVDPGAFEVAPDVFRVPLPLPNDGLRAVNVYVLRTMDGLVCVDAGWAIPQARTLLESALAQLGHGLGDVTRFLVTHAHRDHYTQAVDVRRDAGARIALGAGERPSLEAALDPTHAPLSAQTGRLREVGAAAVADRVLELFRDHTPDRAHWALPDEWLAPGPVVLPGRTLEAVATPGHTAGHLVFHDLDAGLLFAGDHVLPTITPSIGFEPVLSPDPLGDFLRSLAVVRARPDAVLLPAHGPVAPSVHARVDELLDHHGRRLDEVAAAVRAGAADAHAMAGVLRWTRRQHRLADLDPFNAMLAVLEVDAHLEVLVAQGRVIGARVDGTRTYS
jgi:glyoxylase-like metal-dependent hydrolase (beta-lactamase superfamily II)